MRRASAILFLLVLAFLCSTYAFAGIRNSKHDLTAGSSGPSDSNLLDGNRVCIYCHVPHDPAAPDDKPLWNRADSVTTAYTMYGKTLSGSETASEPGRASMRCLSCHDGASAVDAYGGSSGTPEKTIGSPYNVGAGGLLGDEHPISISAAGMGVSISKAEAAGLVFYDDGDSTNVECSTCHDPHLSDNPKFLRISNYKSGLCRTCHDK